MLMMSILGEVRDPRDPTAQHVLAEMLFVALAATLCGAKGFVQIAEFGEARLAELREIVPLEKGMPSHDTFSRVFQRLDPVELERAFRAFMTALRGELGLPPP